MRLGAGEVLHRGTEATGLDNAQIDLQTAGEPDRGARVPLRRDLRDVAEFPEPVNDSRCVDAAHDDVEVADRLLAPAEAAGDVDGVDPPTSLQILDDRPRVLLRLVQDDPLRTGRSACGGHPLTQLFKQFGTEPTQLCDLALVERLLEIGDAVHLELVIKQLHAFRTKTRDAQQIEESGRDLRDELLALRQEAGLDERRDLRGDPAADAREIS